ncbi:phosphoglycolate phosphatase [Actinobacillus equuli]|nr:phosphoglycolate phosphatase [Actinobacillus equuli]
MVITNKPTKLVEPVLSAFGIFELFSEYLGGQSLPKIKPHPDPMLYICENLRFSQVKCYLSAIRKMT